MHYLSYIFHLVALDSCEEAPVLNSSVNLFFLLHEHDAGFALSSRDLKQLYLLV